MIENTKKLPLKDMPENEAVEIFNAWWRGDVLERSITGGRWLKFSKRKYQLAANLAYRIPAREPSFDNWYLLPDWARFIAQDKSGVVFIFEDEPFKGKGVWEIHKGRALEITGFRIGYDPGTGGWENSLVERPGEV